MDIDPRFALFLAPQPYIGDDIAGELIFTEPRVARAFGIFAARDMHMDKSAILAFGTRRAFGQECLGFIVGIGVFQPKPGAGHCEAFKMFIELEDVSLPRCGDVVDYIRVQKSRIENRNLGIIELDVLAVDVNATGRNIALPFWYVCSILI